MLPFSDDPMEQARFAHVVTPRSSTTADLLDALNNLLSMAEWLENDLDEAQQQIATLEQHELETPDGTP
ncbi:MAG: hypothetical protein WAV07_09120 [Candidatus Contendobacter sp.]